MKRNLTALLALVLLLGMAAGGIRVRAAEDNRGKPATRNDDQTSPDFSVDFGAISGKPTKFDFAGMTMTLDGVLKANFIVPSNKVTQSGLYARIIKTDANGGTQTQTVPKSQWTKYNDTYTQITFDGIAAKEMTDNLNITIYNAANQALTNEYNRTVADYLLSGLNNPQNGDDVKKVFVDMLNYGAAAQVQFRYNTDNPANAGITAQQQTQYATHIEMTDADNIQSAQTGFAGVTASLESQLQLNYIYHNTQIQEAVRAQITYTNWLGEEVSATVDRGDFAVYNDNLTQIRIAGFAVADCDRPITVTLLDAQGRGITQVTDSMLSYAARNRGSLPIYQAMINFAMSAQRYLISRNS